MLLMMICYCSWARHRQLWLSARQTPPTSLSFFSDQTGCKEVKRFVDIFSLVGRMLLCAWLRSSSTSVLVAPHAVRATIGDLAFAAAAASVWNNLPETLRASPPLPVFRRRLKTELFVRSYSCSAPWTSHCTDYYVTPYYCYVSLQS